MSEYQYYEFAATDKALNRRQQAELRAISTRATITPTSFVNTYQWGDLKADPRRLIEDYFDAFLYQANWGSHRLMFRVPAAQLDEQTAARYCTGDFARAWASGEHTIIDLLAEDEDGALEDDWSHGGGEGRLASIVPARAGLASGDHRLLYLAWLLCLQSGRVPDSALEPPVPAHLDRLTASLHATAAFLRIDEDLLAAATVTAKDSADPASSADLRRWLATIPEPDKDTILLRLATEHTPGARAELLAHYRADTHSPDTTDSGHRTAADLLAQAQARRHPRERTTTAPDRQAIDRHRAPQQSQSHRPRNT